MTETLIHWLDHLGPIAYLAIFVWIFAETGLLLFLPLTETMVLISGVLASRQVLMLGPVIAIAVVAALLGNASAFAIGRGPARRRFERNGRFLFLRAGDTVRVKNLLDKHRGWAIVGSQFTSVIRVATPFVCGVIDVSPAHFFAYNVPACIAWGILFPALGYLGGNSWESVHRWIGRVSLGLGLVILVGALYWNWKRRRPPN